MPNNLKLTDLHCHILPGIDDGAQNAEASEALLNGERRDGVSQILFTPHFYADFMKSNSFLRRRQGAFDAIAPLCEERRIRTALGAEVRICEPLLDVDLSQLRLGDTHYLLLEWPFDGTYPLYGEDIVRNLLQAGIRPIFAHIDRYDFFFYDEDNLQYFMDNGCLFQMNAEAFLYRGTRRRAVELARMGWAHVLSTDAHNMEDRPPCLAQALETLAAHTNYDLTDQLLQNADDIFHDREVYPAVLQGHRSRRFF